MKNLVLNNLDIEITEEKVIIYDFMHNVSKVEAKRIMQYLLDEAFIENEDIECQIYKM